MTFRWKRENPITFPKDFGAGFFRLPKYVVSFSTEKDPHIVNYADSDHCSARLEITLSREVKSYLLENYLPSTLFVSMSWGSFVVVPEIVPGRMVREKFYFHKSFIKINVSWFNLRFYWSPLYCPL